MRTYYDFRIIPALAILILVNLVLPMPAGAQDYTFIEVPPDSNFNPYPNVAPVINNNGTIGWYQICDGSKDRIYTWSSSEGCRLIAEIVRVLPVEVFLSINDANVVAFTAPLPEQGWGVFVGDGSSITTIADASTLGRDFLPQGSLSGPSINNAGTVAFSLWATVYRASNGKIDLIYSWPGTSVAIPVINDGGVIAYPYGIMGFGWPAGIRTTAGRTIVDTLLNGLRGPFDRSFAMNNAGAVVFPAGDVYLGVGLYIGCGNLDPDGVPMVDVVVDPNGPYTEFREVAINDAGMLAFKALQYNDAGIFTGPDAVADKVVARGDMLLGHVVNELYFSKDGFNDSGQIVFGAHSGDGWGSIVLANPDNPTQPGGLILPVNSEPPWQLIFDIPCNVPTYTCPPSVVIDPEAAIGYDYQVVTGPNFSGVALPGGIGDDLFTLYVWDGEGYVFERVLAASEQFFFQQGGADRFRILDIDPGAGVDPNDPQAFPTNICFTACGHVEMTMTPLTTEPCMVDFLRFARFAKYWPRTGIDLPADLDGDNDVDFADVRLFVEKWLDCCPTWWELN